MFNSCPHKHVRSVYIPEKIYVIPFECDHGVYVHETDGIRLGPFVNIRDFFSKDVHEEFRRKSTFYLSSDEENM